MIGLVLLAVLLIAAAAAAVTVPVTFQWAAPDDGAPVHHYKVYASRNGETFRLEGTNNANHFVLDAEPGVEYRIRVSGVTASGLEGIPSETSDIFFMPEGGSQEAGPPLAPDFKPNYPNPFNPETKLRYGIPEGYDGSSRVALELFDVRGQRVRTFTPDTAPGWHETTWNGRDDAGNILPSGPYVARLVVGAAVATWKLTMVK
jgi:hypothetical protein